MIAILDTNSNPDGISYPVPANDDAGRAIQLYCDLIARAAIDGISRSQGAQGMDLGEAETPAAEPLPETVEPEAAATEPEASTEQFELLAAPRGAPDDLAKLTGVGPQIVKKLNEHGVFHYWQLAAMIGGGSGQARRRSPVQRPHRARQVERPGPRADGRGVAFQAARGALKAKEGPAWRPFPQDWSRICAKRPARA